MIVSRDLRTSSYHDEHSELEKSWDAKVWEAEVLYKQSEEERRDH